MKQSRKRLAALSGIVALAFAGVCALAVAEPAGDAASRLGGLALPGTAAQTEAADEAPADEAAAPASDAASRLGGLAVPKTSSDSAESSAPSSLGGLAAPSKSGGSGLAAPSSSSLGGLAAPGASDAAASDVWSPADGDWTYDLECAACHEKETSSFENEKCLAAKHASLDCKLCHADEEGLVKAHGAITAKSSNPSNLVSTKVDVESTCQLCHDASKLVEATASSVVLTDDNGTVVNPHDIPQNDKHADTTCISCHKIHSTTALEKTATRYCKGCHHAGVYECNTCHTA